MGQPPDWTRYAQLKAQGLSERQIAERLNVPRSTLRRELAKHEGIPAVQRPVQPKDTGAVQVFDT